MSASCPIPTPAQKIYGDMLERVEKTMLDKVFAAIEEAHAAAAAQCLSQGLDEPAPSHDYFASVAHQKLFCKLCGADPRTFAGGKARIAAIVIANAQAIAGRWGAGSLA